MDPFDINEEKTILYHYMPTFKNVKKNVVF
jgi:hypothetical protein